MPESLLDAVTAGDVARARELLSDDVDRDECNGDGATALMLVKEKHYVDVINLLHEAEREAGVGEGSCSTKNAPGSNVVTFLKPRK